MNIFNTLKEKNIQISELQKECVMLKEYQNNYEMEMEELKQALEYQKSEVENLTKEKNLAQLKVKKLEKEAKLLKTRCTDIDQLKEENYNSYDQLRYYESEIEKLRQENEDNEKALRRKYEKEINKLNDVIYCYEQNSKNNEDKFEETLRERLASQEKRFNIKLKDEVNKHTMSVEALREENNRLSEQLQNYKAMNYSTNGEKDSEIYSLKLEVRRLTADANRLVDYKDENQILKDKMETIQRKLDEMTNERNYLFNELQDRETIISNFDNQKNVEEIVS